MTSINLEDWVVEQFHTIGFRDNGEFIGKSNLKSRLVQHYPKRDKEIYKLVNKLIRTEVQLRPKSISSRPKQTSQPNPPTKQIVPAKPITASIKEKSASSKNNQTPQPVPPTKQHVPVKSIATSSKEKSTSYKPKKTSQPNPSAKQEIPAKHMATSSKNKSTSSKPKMESQSSLPPKQSASGPSPRSICARSEDMSDSGFETENEHWEQDYQEGASLETPTPVMRVQLQSLRPANLEPYVFEQENVLNDKKIGETISSLHVSEQIPSNSKISELMAFVQKAMNSGDMPFHEADDSQSVEELQMKLLHFNSDAGAAIREDMSNHDVRNSVLFSDETLEAYSQQILPQYGLLGSCDVISRGKIAGSKIFLNTNIPFSAFICGVQGSGKSHTSTCMIENCLIPTPILGVLEKPLSALVFNFVEYTSRSNFKPSEAAFLAAPNQQFSRNLRVERVNVLVSPSNYIHLSALYTQIPGVEVQPFILHPEDLNIGIMLTLMSVDQSQGSPLYMGTVTKILRNMATESFGAFDYIEFRRRLREAGLERKQEEFLNQRLDLLESFLDLDGSTTRPQFRPGEVTIIDLSCPFVDPSTACVLFKIGMGMFLESDDAAGKVIFVDEAHKFMTDTIGSKDLTESLMGVIRQQRHYGARVIISTQEPTISPQLIDLCSITAIHRFSSPQWLSVLRQHISVSNKYASSSGGEADLFKEILKLKTGEALIFAPSAMVRTQNGPGDYGVAAQDLLRVRIRGRVTWDGGRSIVCV